MPDFWYVFGFSVIKKPSAEKKRKWQSIIGANPSAASFYPLQYG
jgi:hypothetical protein